MGDMPTVLAILAEGFEEIEAIAPIDLLRRAGADVTIAALGKTNRVKGRSGIILTADILLEAVQAQRFDCLLLPGGPHVKLLRADAQVRALVLSFAKNDLWIAAICAAPAILHDLGLLVGRRYTAHFSVANELPEILAELRVVTDGKLITSRGAGTSIDFGLTIVEHLFNPSKAREVSVAICA
jgi:4-methyl-5(b-hydroxyethyl)-thiazole monophosphate biosynthesis